MYPLTEDLKPGDVFLVTTPIQRQAEQYEQRGFLPLDQHLVRLQGLDFKTFYSESFGTRDHPDTPAHWQFPSEEKYGWDLAPNAAFPVYTFDVSSSGGLDLALPIEGVPVALSMMHTDSATGSVTISDSHVFGVSLSEIRGPLKMWLEIEANRELLASIKEAHGTQPIFLRVVSRVYLAKKVSVGLVNTSAFKVGGGVGGAGATIPEGVAGAALANGVGSALPFQGRVSFGFATERAVYLEEQFRRPLVIGYLGFDFPIQKDGSLGSPVVTLESLLGKDQKAIQLGEFTDAQYELKKLTRRINDFSRDARRAVYEAAAKTLSKNFQKVFEKETKDLESVERGFAIAGIQAMGDGSDSIADLVAALKAAAPKTK